METVMAGKLDQVYRRERGKLLAYIRQRVSTMEEAEDILQDVFYQTLRGSSVTRPIEDILGWIYTVARNRIIDWYRRRRPVRSFSQEDESRFMDELHQGVPQPEKAFDSKILAEALADSLEELPEEQRKVFLLHEMEGMTFREMSEKTGESINTLLSRKRYAVMFLRKRLSEMKALFRQSA